MMLCSKWPMHKISNTCSSIREWISRMRSKTAIRKQALCASHYFTRDVTNDFSLFYSDSWTSGVDIETRNHFTHPGATHTMQSGIQRVQDSCTNKCITEPHQTDIFLYPRTDPLMFPFTPMELRFCKYVVLLFSWDAIFHKFNANPLGMTVHLLH